MDTFKELIKISMKLLLEADEYADMYSEYKDHMQLKALFYTLANGHLDMYSKVKTQINNETSRMMSDEPNKHADSIWSFIKEAEMDLCNKVKEKLSN